MEMFSTPKESSQSNLKSAAVYGELKEICNSAQFLTDLARQIFPNESINVVDHQIERYEEKLGAAGHHYLLKITIDRREKKRETVSVFVKGLLARDNRRNYLELVQQENLFYEELASKMNLTSLSNPQIIPQWYGTSENKIFLEDMQSKGYDMKPDITDQMEYLEAVFRCLAHFHAASIVAETKDGGLQENLQKKNIGERIFTLAENVGDFYKAGVDFTCFVADDLGYDANKLRGEFQSILELIRPKDNYINGICHGNVESRNLLFKNSNCILLDYQTYKYAPIATDLLQVLYLHTTTRIREKEENKLIDFYHKIFVAAIGKSIPEDKIPKCAQILSDYNALRSFGLIVKCLYTPMKAIFFNNSEIFNDSGKWNKFVFEERIAMTKAFMSQMPEFRKEIETSTIELADYIRAYKKTVPA